MKKLFLTFFTLLSVCNLMAQKPFKPLSEFQQDTVAYLQYNYGSDDGKAGEALKGKTIGEFLNGSDVQYTSLEFFYDQKDRKIISISLYLQSYDYIKAMRYLSSVAGISIHLPEGLTRENAPEIFDELYSEIRTVYPLNAKNLNLIKNLVILKHYRTGYKVI